MIYRLVIQSRLQVTPIEVHKRTARINDSSEVIEQGKTVSAAIRYLYIYNFGTTNSKMAFLHKNMDGAKDNLQTLKTLRDMLPPYLIMKERMLPDGKVDKGKDNMTEMVNPFNNNSIKVFASATNKARAASLLRGKVLPIHCSNAVSKHS